LKTFAIGLEVWSQFGDFSRIFPGLEDLISQLYKHKLSLIMRIWRRTGLE